MPVNDPDETIAKFLQTCREHPEFFFRTVLGVEAWDKQVEIANSVRDNRYTCVASGHNVGKALPLDTKIPTANGFVDLADVRVGDTLFDRHGDPCSVTALSRINYAPESYEIEFETGETVRACADHEWVAHLTVKSGKRRKPLHSAEPVKTKTSRLYEYLQRKSNCAYMPVVSKAVEYPERELPIDPYVLGIWIGDGSCDSGTVNNVDQEVWREIKRRGYELGDYCKHNIRRTVFGLRPQLRRLGMLDKQGIPEIYRIASKEQRIELLRGLLDSDGSCDKKGAVTFSNTREWISDLVHELAVSLGYKVSRPRRNKTTLYGVRKQDRYRVSFHAPDVLFYVERKKNRQKRRIYDRAWRRIKSVRKCDPVPMRCLTVDSPDHTFLATTSYLPTHNSFISAAICLWFVSCFPQAVVLTTANSWLQVKEVLWKEIRRLHKNAKWPIGGTFKPKQPEFVIGESKMIGFSPSTPDSVNGHHEENILIVFDEAQGLQNFETWDAFSSMMSSGNAKQLAIGNPLYAHGPYYKKFRHPDWNSIQISCLEHPNYLTKTNVIKGAVTHEFLEKLASDPSRGKGSLYWDTRIAGIFPKISSDVYMPEKFVERCVNLHIRDNGAPSKDFRPLPGKWMGVDIAKGSGDDKTVVAIMDEGVIVFYEALPRMDIQLQVLEIRKLAAAYGVPEENINYDPHGGVGAQFTRYCLEYKIPANPVGLSPEPIGDWSFFFGYAESAPYHFKNRRTELHWTLRTVFEEQRISISPKHANRFSMEACELKFGHWNDDGALYIEAKTKYIERTGKSPDYNDAMVLLMNRSQVRRKFHLGGADRGKKFDGDTPKPKKRKGDWR